MIRSERLIGQTQQGRNGSLGWSEEPKGLTGPESQPSAELELRARRPPCTEVPACALVGCVCVLGAGRQQAGGVFRCKRRLIFKRELGI